MIGSALSCIAWFLLGEGPDHGDGAVARACKWILDHGGATGIPSWGKTYLSVLGVYEWAGCNPLPPEFWLFPSQFSLIKLSSRCYMPMSYLFGKKYHGPNTDLLKSPRQEIHPEPYDEIDWNKARQECCKGGDLRVVQTESILSRGSFKSGSVRRHNSLMPCSVPRNWCRELEFKSYIASPGFCQ